MAYTFSVNNTPANGSIAMYTLISTLVSAGWVKKADSDGTTYSATGVQVTSGATGTNGLGNNSAWVRIQAPAVNGGSVVNQQREFTFQRGTTDLAWRIKYSASAGFITGGSAAVTPSSADEVFMFGGGTDAAPTYYGSALYTNAGYRWHICCGGAAEFYSFVAWGVVNASTLVQNVLCLDVMAIGSFPSIDVDPAVTFFGTIASAAGNNTFASTNTTNPAQCRAWLGSTSAAGAATTLTNNQGVSIISYYTTIGPLATLGTNPFTGKDDLIPCLWGRAGATVPIGVKGFSTLFMWGTVNRAGMDTCDTIGTKDKVFLTYLWAPWSGATPII
jgi:hypothetical protein